LAARFEGMGGRVPAGGVVQLMVVEPWDLDPSPDPCDGEGAHVHGGGEGVDRGGWDAGWVRIRKGMESMWVGGICWCGMV
jgi:hypothetical protein